MKVLMGEPVRKENFMVGVLVLIATILFISAYLLYDKRDETEGAKFATRANDLLKNVTTVEEQQRKLFAENKAFSDSVLALLSDINTRVVNLEKPKIELPHPQNVNLHLKEPITFNVVYHDRPHQEVVPPQISGKKTPLMNRAKENN